MAKKKAARKKTSYSNMSSDDLFKIAEDMKKEEIAKEMEATKEKISTLREKRRDSVARHNKQVAKIDAQIRKLGGKSTKRRSSGRRGSVTSTILSIIGSAGKISTADLKADLKKKGVNTGNLPQTLAYLKKQGRVSSPSRAIYKLA